ncbi:LuxR family transcriptional regulator [Bradyrhizobium sp. AUGA SZCCT0176]|uniref:LuxR family transcriptional regulator n=1 Tax=Bradyrhizobium sp. AUGA SZCCT0176 TaxID=2807664 RepID=UPI001BA9B1FF|nr:LuxR family transcriptional regulator [Bradyrhizobium sp. AUGA SZCCT0176]MBR1225114.1 LuxR family transcriptional regulator [Bradyrhizobium sp. AUGA SZCCT0176]
MTEPSRAADVAGDSAVSEFLVQLDRATCTSQIRSVFQEAIEPMGYRYFAYHVVQNEVLFENTSRQMLGITNYPEHWLSHYIGNDYVNCDPIVDELFRCRVPFVWSKIAVPDRMSCQQKRLMDEASDFGIRDGLTIPLVSRTGEKASVSLVHEGRARAIEAALTNYSELHVMCEFFHSRALRIVDEEHLKGHSRRRKSFLSRRETQSIFWAARGKSAWEIAKILNISAKCVEFYLESVKKKLNAVNRTQAAVKAAKLGLLDIDPSSMTLDIESG